MKQTIKYGQSPQHKTRNGKAIGERSSNIIDIIGKKIQTIDLQCGKRIVSTSINEICSGIYTIVISQNGKKLLNQKLYVE